MLEIQNNTLNGRTFLSSASGKKAFAFLAAEELKITPPRIRNTYPADDAIKLKV